MRVRPVSAIATRWTAGRARTTAPSGCRVSGCGRWRTGASCRASASPVGRRRSVKPAPQKRRKRNLLRAEGVEYVDWKDTALLRKFLSDRGKIRARRITGLTPSEQKDVARAIKNAREMALLPYPVKKG